MENVKWRFLPLESYSPAMNMAIDEALMYSAADGVPVVRFFKWKPNSVSLAYKQILDEIDTEKCRELNIGYVRRPTGGRAIYHDTNDELSYSVIAPQNILHPGQESYQIICRWIMDGLDSLGLDSCLINKNDILVGGKKIIGSAQYQRYFPEKTSRVLLQHGSVNYKTDYLKQAFEVFHVRNIGRALEIAGDHITSIYDSIGSSYDDAYSALRDAFLEGKGFEESEITQEELSIVEDLVRKKYEENTEWTKNEGNERRGFCHLIWGSSEKDKDYKNRWDELVE